MRKYPWKDYAALGRLAPRSQFSPRELRNVPVSLANAIQKRAVRALRFDDGKLEPIVEHYNPETRRCDIWLRWIPRT